jgi:hypothetical protein
VKAATEAIAGVLTVDPAVLQGASPDGHALLNAPNPVQPGSSISHWDPVTFPNQLMEPAINADLTHEVSAPVDLTLPLFRDIGWYADRDLDFVDDEGVDQCVPSDLRPTVFVGTRDSGVANTFFANGCTISDLLTSCTGGTSHGQVVSCTTRVVGALKAAGFLTPAERGLLQSLVAQQK